MMKKNIIVCLYNINKYYHVLQSSGKNVVFLFFVSLAVAYLEVQIEGSHPDFPHGDIRWEDFKLPDTTWHYYRCSSSLPTFLFFLFHGLQQANVLFFRLYLRSSFSRIRCGSFFKKNLFPAIHGANPSCLAHRTAYSSSCKTWFHSLFILMTLTFVSYPFQTRVESTPAKNLDVGENNPVPV